MNSIRKITRTLELAGALCVSILVASPASADIVGSGSSNAYNLESSLSVIGLVNLPISPVNLNSGMAPSPYSVSNSLISFSTGGALSLASLSTATLTTAASSDVDGTAGSKMATASSQVNNLNMRLGSSLAPLVTLSFDLISNNSTVTGAPGSFASMASMDVTNLKLAIIGFSPLSFSAQNVGANTVLLDAGGVNLTLNKQVSVCGAVSCSMDADALNLTFTNALIGTNIINGSFIVGHSYASMAAAVPEPSSWLMMALGLGFVSLVVGRRKNYHAL